MCEQYNSKKVEMLVYAWMYAHMHEHTQRSVRWFTEATHTNFQQWECGQNHWSKLNWCSLAGCQSRIFSYAHNQMTVQLHSSCSPWTECLGMEHYGWIHQTCECCQFAQHGNRQENCHNLQRKEITHYRGV